MSSGTEPPSWPSIASWPILAAGQGAGDPGRWWQRVPSRLRTLPRRPDRRWQRVTAWAVVLVVLVAVTGYVTTHSDYHAYRATQSTDPVTAARGHSAHFAGARWTLSRIQVNPVEPPGAGPAPQGTLVVVTIAVATPNAAVRKRISACSPFLQSADGRRWAPSTDSVDDVSFGCDSPQDGAAPPGAAPAAGVETYQLTFPFRVPAAVASTAAVAVTLLTQNPHYLRLKR